MTTASATSAPALLSSARCGRRLPATTGDAFAEELERAPQPQRQHDRASSRRSSGGPRPQRDNNVDQGAAVATPATAAYPQGPPLVYCRDCDAQAETDAVNNGADAGVQPAAAATPQPPATTQAPRLADSGPQTTAFMMRLQAAGADNASVLQQGLAEADVPNIKKAGEEDTQEPPSPSQAVAQTHSALAALDQAGRLDFRVEVRQAAAPFQPPELRAVRSEEQPRAPQPLNNILLQVNHSADEKVLVRLVQQSGELRLAVRTDDQDLAHGLQQGLTDLVGKLQQNGYRTDSWHPVQPVSPTGPTAESQSAPDHSRQGDSQSQPGWSQQDGGRHNHSQSNRPRWVEELELNLTGGGPVTGESYGITR